MREILDDLVLLRDSAYQLAGNSLKAGNTMVYRGLTEVTKKINALIPQAIMYTEAGNNSDLIDIFKNYKGQLYKAKLDMSRYTGEGSQCVYYVYN